MPTITRKQSRNQPLTNNLQRKERIKIYNSQRWRRIRIAKLMETPLCEKCGSPAEDVHHIVSFMTTDDPMRRKFLAYDFSNLQSLCKQCHQHTHNSYECR